VAIGVTVNGERDTLAGGPATVVRAVEFWLSVLTEIKSRGVQDRYILVCDGLIGPARLGRRALAVDRGPDLVGSNTQIPAR
jgi:transposase-like protein